MSEEKKDEWMSTQGLKAAKLVDAAWVAGFGLALSEVEQRLSQPSVIRNVCDAAGVDMAAFRASGLEGYDLKFLRRAFKRLPRLRRNHSRDGRVRCDICSPLRCSKAK